MTNHCAATPILYVATLPKRRRVPGWANAQAPTAGSGEMGKPGRDRAPSPVNPGDSATRQEVCFEGPPTRVYTPKGIITSPLK